ncbi:MAG: hypothetical protein IPK19_40210 [Chloroflexi bacterium]|nr:hypothetical protein [Chloroflexota bacterium]
MNSVTGLILIYVALYAPFATYLLRSYMVPLPKGVRRGSPHRLAPPSWHVFRHIIMPLSWPGFLTAGAGRRPECLEQDSCCRFRHLSAGLRNCRPIASSLFAFQAYASRATGGLFSTGSVISGAAIIIPVPAASASLHRSLTQGGLEA